MNVRAASVLLLYACTDAPRPPPPLTPARDTRTQQVAFGAVRGALVRPLTQPERRAEVWTATPNDPSWREKAQARAQGGVRVLLLDPDTEPTRAIEYLRGMEPAVDEAVVCPQGACAARSATRSPSSAP